MDAAPLMLTVGVAFTVIVLVTGVEKQEELLPVTVKVASVFGFTLITSVVSFVLHK